jgi:sporulation protein YabP
MNETNIIAPHEHQLNYFKNQLSLSGVKEVVSFEERVVVLSLSDRGMVVKGEGLTVAELNLKSGILKINGSVLNIAYTKTHEKLSLVKKLFK